MLFHSLFRRIRSLDSGSSGKLSASALRQISHFPRFTPGYITIQGRPFRYHDNLSFIHTYIDIFETEIYKFCSSGEKSVILDCGANMGLSVLYFAERYPDHRIVAFEPQGNIYSILEENVARFELKNVELHRKAIWTDEGTLNFYPGKGMGGRLNIAFQDKAPEQVSTVRLRDFITEDVDFLKLDIEGAEEAVIDDCRNKLRLIQHIFFEHHSTPFSPQRLHHLLEILQGEGFRYYLKESGVRNSPFVDKSLICEVFEYALNIFCYKES